ncbi:hypothetical protein FQA39_LY03487 [Lamprigera yunnana]|nr:hypothetical protein FQA39_LY03487 [Lamprigera yunnana]
MIDKNIDERFRKPRRSKGTPFFKQRSLFALGVLGVGFIFAAIHESWSKAKKLKQGIQDGQFNYPSQLKQRILVQNWSNHPEMNKVLQTIEEKHEAQQPQPESAIFKLFRSSPDL